MWGAHWTIQLEKRGVPSIYLVDDPFVLDVQTSCERNGMSRLRRVIIPHPCGDITDEQLPEIVPEVLRALTEPLTGEELSQDAINVKEPSTIIVEKDLDKVNDLFYEKGWTDGLPIIPPTEEKVARMLTGTSHSPDDTVVEDMLPESLTVSVEKVAVVGAMAGCEPKYMPLLLSMIEAFANDMFSSSVRSTTSFSFATVVNGPFAEKIGMNSGINALGAGSGNKANATIGRFLRLAIICLGGSRSGISDMSSQGNPSKYSFAFAENQRKSPWEPFHVSLGYRAEESVVSILSGGWNHNSPFGNSDLDQIAKTISTYELPNGVLILMDPMSAKKLSDRGYSKQSIEEYIWSHATKTLSEFKADFFYPIFIEPVLKGKPWYGKQNWWPEEYLNMAPDEIVPAYPRQDVRVVVLGGQTNPFIQVWHMSRPSSVVIDKWE